MDEDEDDTPELVDLGKASEKTKGFQVPVFIELGVPPNNYTFFA